VRERAAQAGDRARRRRELPAAAQLLVGGAAVQPVGEEDQALGRDRAARDGVQDDLGAEPVPADHRARPEHLTAEGADDLGEPRARVGMPRAILGVAVQRQVGKHDPVAIGELLDDRLELLVGEHRRVQQRQRRTAARLPVGDARAVAVVIQPQPHTAPS